VPEPDEAEVVRWIFSAVANEGRTIRQAAKLLDEAGTLERRWRPSEVGRILRRVEYKRRAADGTRVIDPRVWNRADAVLSARRKA
jgi:hypothetical protein